MDAFRVRARRESFDETLQMPVALFAAGLGFACKQALPATRSSTVRTGSFITLRPPPVDMDRPFHETVPQRFPGGHMIVSDDACPPLSMSDAPVTPSGRAAPLLTDRRPRKP